MDAERLAAVAIMLFVFATATCAACALPAHPSCSPPPTRFVNTQEGMDREVRDIQKMFGEHKTRMGVWKEVGIMFFAPGQGAEERVMPLLERGAEGGREWEYSARNKNGIIIPIAAPQATTTSLHGRFRWNDRLYRDTGTLDVLGYGRMNYTLLPR